MTRGRGDRGGRGGPDRRMGGRGGDRNRGFRGPRDGVGMAPESKEPVLTKITPFGMFIYQEGKLLKTELWKDSVYTAAEKYFNYEDETKRLNATLPIKAKRIKERIFGNDMQKLAVDNGFDQKSLAEFLQKFSIELTKLKMKFGFKRDKLIVQAVNSYDELVKMCNILYERISEWYGFYYPEMIERVENMEEFAELAGQKRTEKSMGFDISDEDLKIIREMADELKTLLNKKEELENYIEKAMSEIAQNLTKVAGAILGAKFIAHAGSLEKLAKLPSSTIQLLGAEKALFRHLRRGSRSPKHGIILQHSSMKGVPIKDRGKLARSLAGKIAIAVKVDVYSHNKSKVWEGINKGIETKVEGMKNER